MHSSRNKQRRAQPNRLLVRRDSARSSLYESGLENGNALLPSSSPLEREHLNLLLLGQAACTARHKVRKLSQL